MGPRLPPGPSDPPLPPEGGQCCISTPKMSGIDVRRQPLGLEDVLQKLLVQIVCLNDGRFVTWSHKDWCFLSCASLELNVNFRIGLIVS